MNGYFGQPQLPGLHDEFLRLELTYVGGDAGDDEWTLAVTPAESAGHVSALATTRYERLTLGEATDVMGAILDALR